MAPPARNVRTMQQKPTSTSTGPQVFNISQAAQYLGIDRGTMRGYIDAGVVASFRAGNITRIRRADLDRLFTDQPGAAS